MRRITLGLLLVSVFGLSYAPALAGKQHEVPFVGVVQETSTPVYSGAARTFYEVGELTGDTLVTVDEVLFGWFKIEPPQGFYSYILARHVEHKEGSTRGWVRSRRAEVRAANPKGVSSSFRRQLFLLNGAPVRIVSRDGKYLKIVPPTGAYVFLPPGSVKPATEADLARGVSGPRPGGVVAGGQEGELNRGGPGDLPELLRIAPRSHRKVDEAVAASQVAGTLGNAPAEDVLPGRAPADGSRRGVAVLSAGFATQAVPRVVAHDPDRDVTTGRLAESQAVRAAVRNLRDMDGVALEDQHVQELVHVFEALSLNDQLSKQDREIVSAGLRRLRQRAAVLTALRAITTARGEGAAGVLHEGEPVPLYDVKGQLLASSVYDGTNRPRLFRVVEPSSQRTIAYVVPSPSIRPGACLGRNVGIIGRVRVDPALKLRVIAVERLDVIETPLASRLQG